MADTTARVEHDLLGDRRVPFDAYYGVHTLRAIENFAITGVPIATYPELIRAIAAVKQAAALANRDLHLLESRKADAIVQACEEIRAGALVDQFPVDVVQGGAGTSTNMNANEVIANRALEILGHERGEYQHLHPLDDVNMGQSTNDVYPTAVKIAAHDMAVALASALSTLVQAFRTKATEFDQVLKMGRTQLQDAVPMTLGQEFAAFANTLDEGRQRLLDARQLLYEINLGGTAIGTGITTHPDYARLAREHLAAITGLPLVTAPDLVQATQDTGAFVQLSSALKHVAIKLSKVCNDLRLLSSGPRAGLGDINLPPMQAGSSIMPGKVNPVIPEVVNQIAFAVMGYDVTVSVAAEAGQLQLNAFEPIIAHCLYSGMRQLRAGCLTLAERCVEGITDNRARLRETVEHSVGIVTALNPYIGYANATMIAQEALQTGRSIPELALAHGLLTQDQLDHLLRPDTLTRPHVVERVAAAR